MTRYLVTGATGFVGPHLCSALADEGFEVWSTDRGHDTLGEHHVRCELTDPDPVRRLLEHVQPAGVFHLAGLSSVARSFSNPQDVLRVNVLATCNLLEALRRSSPDTRVLVVGSAEQYGPVPAAEQPIQESRSFQPTSPYAVSKVAQEYLALQYAASSKLDVVVTRSFNHTGPGQSDRFVLASFARQIAEAERGLCDPVIRVGNLEVRRDFLDVRDVARAYVLLMQKGRSGTAYNVCSGQSYRLRALLDTLLANTPLPIRVETDPQRLRSSDLPLLHGDATLLRSQTGWTPRIEIERTLGDLLDHQRKKDARA